MPWCCPKGIAQDGVGAARQVVLQDDPDEMGGNFADIGVNIEAVSERATTSFGVEMPGETRGIREDQISDLVMGLDSSAKVFATKRVFETSGPCVLDGMDGLRDIVSAQKPKLVTVKRKDRLGPLGRLGRLWPRRTILRASRSRSGTL